MAILKKRSLLLFIPGVIGSVLVLTGLPLLIVLPIVCFVTTIAGTVVLQEDAHKIILGVCCIILDIAGTSLVKGAHYSVDVFATSHNVGLIIFLLSMAFS